MATTEKRRTPGPATLVAVILAVGISAALIFMTAAALYVVVISHGNPATLGENTTQVLTGWGGGMLGVLGAFVGYAFGDHKRADSPQDVRAGGSVASPKTPMPPEPLRPPAAPRPPDPTSKPPDARHRSPNSG